MSPFEHEGPQSAAEHLTDGHEQGSVRAALATAMVGMKAKYYGKGPTKAKAHILEDHVFVLMEGGLTRNEETLLAAGKSDLIRVYRLAFEETMRATTVAAVEEIVGRKVLDYHSQIVFDPPYTLEWFILEPAGSGRG